MDYEQVSTDPIILERRGLAPGELLGLMLWGGLIGSVASALAYPLLGTLGDDAPAIGFTGVLLFGVSMIVGAFLAGNRAAMRTRIIGQPGRVSVELEPSGTCVHVDRRRFASAELRRVEVHRVPLQDMPDRYMLALVLDFGLVELSWTDEAAAVAAANLLAEQLDLPPVIRRDRPMFRSYGLAPALLVVLALLALVGGVVWLMTSEPTRVVETLPLVIGLLAGTLGLYYLVRASGAPLTRDYLATEYELDP